MHHVHCPLGAAGRAPSRVLALAADWPKAWAPKAALAPATSNAHKDSGHCSPPVHSYTSTAAATRLTSCGDGVRPWLLTRKVNRRHRCPYTGTGGRYSLLLEASTGHLGEKATRTVLTTRMAAGAVRGQVERSPLGEDVDGPLRAGWATRTPTDGAAAASRRTVARHGASTLAAPTYHVARVWRLGGTLCIQATHVSRERRR